MSKTRQLQRHETVNAESYDIAGPEDFELEVGYRDRDDNLALIVRWHGHMKDTFLTLSPSAVEELRADLEDENGSPS
jgi:hypothetical protein